jgi:RNA polymerase sigma factor (sigma-70 family)
MREDKKLSFEDMYEDISIEIKKRKNKWRLTSICWMDFEDVSQIIAVHIHKKWDQWDQSRPLLPWVNKLITNQLKNLLRNHYHSFVKPCVGCPFNTGYAEEDISCDWTKSGIQDKSCPLYKKWEKSKKYACNIKIPVSIDAAGNSRVENENSIDNIDFFVQKINKLLKENLTEKQYLIYKMLFIDEMGEEEVAESLGYKTTEKGRKAGYKQIKNLKVKYKKIISNLIEKKDILH